jgi:hypothetical protein
MRSQFKYVALVTVLALGTTAAGLQSAQSASDTFTWPGELVSVDATARTMTVKARVAYQEALSELKQFKAGQTVWVVWSGLSDSSDAVRQFRRLEGHQKRTDEGLVMQAELVSPDATNQYVTLRVKVPEAALAAIESVKPGEWVTVTSRQHPATEAESVVGVKPYNESSTAATATTK